MALGAAAAGRWATQIWKPSSSRDVQRKVRHWSANSEFVSSYSTDESPASELTRICATKPLCIVDEVWEHVWKLFVSERFLSFCNLKSNGNASYGHDRHATTDFLTDLSDVKRMSNVENEFEDSSLSISHKCEVASIQVRRLQISLIVFALTPKSLPTLTLLPLILESISWKQDLKLWGMRSSSLRLYISAALLVLSIIPDRACIFRGRDCIWRCSLF